MIYVTIKTSKKHEAMMSVLGCAIEGPIYKQYVGYDDINTRSYHCLFDLVVNGHHTGTRGAEREEKHVGEGNRANGARGWRRMSGIRCAQPC